MAIRFSNAPSNFTLYDEGKYDFRIEEVDQGTSKNNNPQLKVKLAFVGGKYDGKNVTAWYSLLESAQFRVRMLVDATGCPHQVVGQDKDGHDLIEFDENDLIGLFFTADCKHNKYDGKTNNKIENEEPCGDEADEAPADPAPQQQQAAPATSSVAKPAFGRPAGVARRPRGATA